MSKIIRATTVPMSLKAFCDGILKELSEKYKVVVPSKDAKSLYNAMERRLTDDVLREKIKKNARPMIASRFERSFVRKCLYDFYDEIM